MCEYCGCQQIPAIRRLTDEHDEILAVVVTARQAITTGDSAVAASTARTLLDLLTPHAESEEQGLFAVLAPEFPEHVASLESEHRHIDAALADVARRPGAAGWEQRLGGILDKLSAHIFKEQDGLFPAALATLGPADWDFVDAAIAGLPGFTREHVV